MTEQHGSNAEQYMNELIEEDELLLQIKATIRENKMPEVSVEPGYGRLLTLLVQMSGARSVLEIGALGGYSGVCMARGMNAGGRIVSLELRPDYAEVAQEHMRLAGYGDQVEYRIGEAIHSLAELQQEGQRFDFFFIDADKLNYVNYLDYALELATPGAIIVGDNLLLRGRTLNLERNGPAIQTVREFNRRMASDPRLTGTLLPAYDGLAIARVKG
ncbi:O-methyltransferase [Paenibacillus hunanensis]|uniref:O-methyltransferase YrrM n=1 Tax=Paenibacillus hunanensis TaxID=539262 RepID=A0ABU1J5C8_9BACL|nr:O-methyltransferase [Paenibacillus hunanensis]MCL9663176.1 O-methyltransferase [Paenibacillus hunanensis]MDR6246703.1 putative O-methyltransferase YrrM [Paenibacillus hunanensis]GGJ32812.1 O-methyltransferase [Paenibacillus hunanensis]